MRPWRVLAVLTLVMVAASCSTPSTTPSGWVAVTYGHAQVSVPQSFSILHRLDDACHRLISGQGVVFVGTSSESTPNCGVRFKHPDRPFLIVFFGPAPRSRFDNAYVDGLEKPIVINGLRIDPLKSAVLLENGLYAPSLGVAVILAGGPFSLARRVGFTLSRSGSG